MKLYSIVIATILVTLCNGVYAGDAKSEPMPPKEKPALTQVVYVCPHCHAAALKPGKCACGAELEKMHLLGTKDGQAILCTCGAECNCDFKGMKDGKCACGKEVKMAALKDVYCCPKGCPVISAKPGKCACGEEMVKAE